MMKGTIFFKTKMLADQFFGLYPENASCEDKIYKFSNVRDDYASVLKDAAENTDAKVMLQYIEKRSACPIRTPKRASRTRSS